MVIVLSSCNTAQRDEEGNVVEAGNVGARNVQVGDCYNDHPDLAEGETLEISGVDAVPCGDAHDNEAFAVYDLAKGEFPGEDEVVELSFAGCLERFADFTGIEFDRTTLDIGILYPLEVNWDDDDRQVVCSVYDPAGAVTGSLEGQGETYRLAGQGDCMADSGLAVDCSIEHYAEMYFETELDGDAFPGTDIVDEQAYTLCLDAYAEFVGLEWDASSLDFVYFAPPDEASWDGGYRLVSCAVIDPAGPLTGSVQGSGL
jgi:hypothetical protein